MTGTHLTYICSNSWRPVASSGTIVFAAVVYFIVNTFPVAVVIALTEGKSLREVWGGCYCWTFPDAAAAIVSALSFANRMLNWEAWILILPVVYTVYRSYHLYLATWKVNASGRKISVNTPMK